MPRIEIVTDDMRATCLEARSEIIPFCVRN